MMVIPFNEWRHNGRRFGLLFILTHAAAAAFTGCPVKQVKRVAILEYALFHWLKIVRPLSSQGLGLAFSFGYNRIAIVIAYTFSVPVS
jgi:hypothetical protein